MATSGSVSTSKYDGRYYTVSWTATQDVSTNKSTISWTLKAVGGSSSWYAERTLNVTIAGTEVYSKTSRVERYTGTIKTGTITLTHDSSGNKSFTIKVNAAVYTSSVNCTGSKSFTLTQIPRQATITSAPNFNDEGNPVLKYSNPAGTAVTTLQACIASTDGKTIYCAYRDISKSGTSYTFSLTDAERTTLRKACASANTMKVKFYIKTVISSSTFYSTSEKTLTIVNANPTLSPSVYVSSDSDTYKFTGSTTKFIKYYTWVSYSIGAAALKNATISSQKITVGDLSATAASGQLSGALTTNKATFTTTDSRGNTTTKDVTLDVVNYVKLTCVLSGNMSVDGVIAATIKGNYFNGSFGAVNNTLTVKYRYKKTTDSAYGSWTTATATLSGNNYTANITISGLDYKSKYQIQAQAIDALSTITSNTITLTCMPVFDWGENDFNFNVPATYTDDSGTYSFAQIGKALMNNTSLPCTVTAGDNYSSASGSAYLIGNVLRIYFTATRSSQISAGNNDNEIICSFSINTGGKILGTYTVYGICANNNSCYYLGGASVSGDTLTFNIMLSSVGIAATTFTSYFATPVRIDLSKF